MDKCNKPFIEPRLPLSSAGKKAFAALNSPAAIEYLTRCSYVSYRTIMTSESAFTGQGAVDCKESSVLTYDSRYIVR